ncbi:cytochrome P450 [Solimonas terrae]|uniref:Cytochrome P450 n=2 Tax=Solimonas terrae TaxID=1396819 RepID=A0A6M2BNK4_9GAMM|nr:cytochrome P450 [Solimonas terrae]
MASLQHTQPPVFFNTSDNIGNAWMLTGYDDAYFVLRHPEIFTTRGSVGFPRSPDDWFDFIPLEIDPPQHRRYRGIVDPLFSPKAIAKLEASIRALANELIDAFIDRRECEFTRDFGRPLPVSVFLGLMGLPQDMRDTFVDWAVGLLHSQSREVAGNSMRSIAAYLKDVIADKTRHPDDGVISTIVHTRPDGEPLSDKEVFGFVFFLFIGGLDTVFATLNNVFLWLAENPRRRQEIIDRPDHLAAATEELLRVFSVTFAGRLLTQDHELHGVQMKKGDKLTCILPAANYDPAAFEHPQTIDFDRPRKPMLAFAGGVHSCMGAHLARLEMRVCIGEFLRRIPDFRLQDGCRIEYYPGGVVGPKALPLCW